MRYTLLDMAQTILSSMDSDEINSITDSVEAQQVIKVIRTTYYDLVDRANLPEQYSLVNLVSSGDNAKPILMSVPETVAELMWIKYNKQTITTPVLTMGDVKWLCLEDFLATMYQLDASDTSINGTMTHTIDGSTFTFIYRLNKAPDYYTTFNDKTLVFDSYDNTVDTTLQSSKTQAYARLLTPWADSDTFDFPLIDDTQFPLLLNEAKSLAWAELKQTTHAKAEASAKRAWDNLPYSKYAAGKTPFFNTLPNYGRK